jgi:hypothetical protein
MNSFVVIVVEPGIGVILELFKNLLELLSGGNSEELTYRLCVACRAPLLMRVEAREVTFDAALSMSTVHGLPIFSP